MDASIVPASQCHGVGPMRRYSIWAELLDLDDPSRVIGRLHEAILTPDEHERDGYVPNVVYSCGSMIHADTLIFPYGVADQRCRIATVSIAELLRRFKDNQRFQAGFSISHASSDDLPLFAKTRDDSVLPGYPLSANSMHPSFQKQGAQAPLDVGLEIFLKQS